MFSPKNNSTLKINWSQRSSLRIHWNFWRVHVCGIWGKWPKWGGKLSSLLIPRPSHVWSIWSRESWPRDKLISWELILWQVDLVRIDLVASWSRENWSRERKPPRLSCVCCLQYEIHTELCGTRYVCTVWTICRYPPFFPGTKKGLIVSAFFLLLFKKQF